jgi:ribosome-associated translation inhibitor RaiA
VTGTESPRTEILDEVLRLGAGFTTEDRPWLLAGLAALVPHLTRWDTAELALEISVKHRGGKEQQLSLRAHVPGYPPLVATAVDENLDRALAEVRRELIRQIDDEKKKREPQHNRTLRKKTP